MLSHEQLEAELAREASELSALRGAIAVRRFVAQDSGICGGLRADIAEDWLHQASGTEAPMLQRLGLRVWGSGFDGLTLGIVSPLVPFTPGLVKKPALSINTRAL